MCAYKKKKKTCNVIQVFRNFLAIWFNGTQNPSPYSEITTNEKHEPMINLTGCRIDPVGEKAETELRNNKIQTPLKEKKILKRYQRTHACTFNCVIDEDLP